MHIQEISKVLNHDIIGTKRTCRGRRPLAFLGKLGVLFFERWLLLDLLLRERHVVYTITQGKQTKNK